MVILYTHTYICIWIYLYAYSMIFMIFKQKFHFYIWFISLDITNHWPVIQWFGNCSSHALLSFFHYAGKKCNRRNLEFLWSPLQFLLIFILVKWCNNFRLMNWNEECLPCVWWPWHLGVVINDWRLLDVSCEMVFVSWNLKFVICKRKLTSPVGPNYDSHDK